MKQSDKEKEAWKMVQMTITVPKYAAIELERKAKKNDISPSKIVSALLQRYVATDDAWYNELAKFHCGKMHEYMYLREQAKTIKEITLDARE